MIYGHVQDQYGFFILKDVSNEEVEQLLDDICTSLYMEAKLRAKGVNLDENITPYPEDGFDY